VYVVKKFDIEYVNSKKETDRKIFNNSFPIFLNNLFVSGYTVANMTILGMYYSNYEIGIYGGAQKLIMAILMLTSMPINIGIFPWLSREFEKSTTNGLLLLKRHFYLLEQARS